MRLNQCSGNAAGAISSAVEPLAQGRSRLVDKMPANFLHAGLIPLILPGARIIHARRNPVDTCLSCYTKLLAGDQPFAYELTEPGEYYRDYERLMAHWRSVLPAGRFIEVDYEAVVDDLEGEARRLVNFLDLPWDDACLRFHENRRVVRTASLNQVRQPMDDTADDSPIVIGVSDTGIGMTPQQQETLFHAFSQADCQGWTGTRSRGVCATKARRCRSSPLLRKWVRKSVRDARRPESTRSC
ncbi:hypothetical protein HDG32_001871 [Paraburkholderia sp. CI2]|nr:hypothetical protein [Paraburkholderia sp. CI2]